MNSKKAVLLKKVIVPRYAYQKLKYCAACGRYTVLDNGPCPACRNNKKTISLDKLFDMNLKRRFLVDYLILLILFFIGLISARNLSETIIMLISGVSLHTLMFVLHKFFKISELACLIYVFFSKHTGDIFSGLKKDVDIAMRKMKGQYFKEAYEDLREISVLLNTVNIKISKLICLNKFILRKDMDLELDTLILPGYDFMLVKYINEVAKLNRSIVKRNVIEYVIAHEGSILNEKIGIDVLGNTAGAAIRIRENVLKYRDFILKYAKVMKKDRILRLYRLLKDKHEEELVSLYKETVDIIHRDYKDDPDFRELVI